MNVPDGGERVSFSYTNGESGGGTAELIVWADGRSRGVVTPVGFGGPYVPASGWQFADDGGYLYRDGVLPEREAAALHDELFQLGVNQINAWRFNYADGGAYAIAWSIDGVEGTVTTPIPYSGATTTNQRRVELLEAAMPRFDWLQSCGNGAYVAGP